MQVYADNAATTRMSDKAVAAMTPYFQQFYGNPSSLHTVGQQAAEALADARRRVAECLGCSFKEITFTSGGSEADNQAIVSAARIGERKGKKHIISTAFEHHAVLHTLKKLEKEGFEVTLLDVGPTGTITPQQVAEAIREDTCLVTIMYANNEIGTVQPIKEIGALCRKHKIWFHTDAVQAFGHVPINVEEQNIDMLSVSGHKIHAQKGVGLLYVKRGVVLPNLIDGGAQERGKRAGTENIAGIVGLAKAMEIASQNIEERGERTKVLRDKLIDNILKIDRTRLNGDREQRLPGNVNISIEGIEGESLLLSLDMYGICASSGSACTSGSLDPSHVLLAIGLCHEVAHGSLRISLSDENTMEDVDRILEVLPGIVERLRSMSPLWEKIQRGEDTSVKMIH